jgi:hypothetical protein
MCNKDVCAYDFNGYTDPGHFPSAYWADWCPFRESVEFGGDWSEIPAMPAKTYPTEDEVTRWAKDHWEKAKKARSDKED